jgi:hypothetical protein
MMLRFCEAVPPPHEAEHAPQSDQSLTSQLTPHGSVLQGVLSSSAGHPSPPLCGVC